jgi:hypothetical protein
MKDYFIIPYCKYKISKKMKRIILTSSLVLLIAISNSSYAQSQLPPGQTKEAAAKFEGYKTELNLSAEQSAKVKGIDSLYFESLRSLKDAGGSKITRYRKFKEISSARDKQMQEVLNKEQYKQYQQIKSDSKKELKTNRNNN